MKKNTLLLCLFAVILLASCARLPQRSVAQKEEKGDLLPTIPEWFDTDSLRVAYLYSEGIRVATESGRPIDGLPYWLQILKIDSLHGGANHQMSVLGAEISPTKALHYGRRAVEADTTNMEFLGQYAYSQVASGHYKAALQTYNTLLQKEPRNPYNYRMAAALYANEGMPHMAISLLDSAEYKLGYYEELASYKRSLLIGVRNYDRAISETQSAIANHPFDHSNFRILGEIYARTGQDSLAVANFQRAIELAPEDGENLMAAGEYYLSRGNYPQYFDLVKRLFMLDGEALKNKLDLYDNLIEDTNFYRRNFYAINTLCSILRVKYPDSSEVATRYATHLIRAGEIDKALEVYRQEVAKGGASLETHLMVVDIESYLGLRDEMFSHLDQAIALYPQEGSLYIRKAFELQKGTNPASERTVVGLYKKAIAVADSSDDRSDNMAALGDYYHSIGKPDKSFSWYAKALEQNPDNALVLNNWAYFLSEYNKDLDRALAMSVRACELVPSNPTYLDTQAWILHLLGRSAEAKTVMMQAVSLDTTGDDTLLLHYAEILAATGSNFMARMYYNKALEAGGDKDYIEQRLSAIDGK
ncbi:MAG: tetratricopeptide repeat protein [Tidjanibacter sp.]|nr:tetratricopeptide repeat protein [Tidjanibacter sp.]